MEQWDNKLEDQIFENILNNRSLSGEILKISDLIMSQKINSNYKATLHFLIVWRWIVNEDQEIQEIIQDIRAKDKQVPLISMLIFKIIEEVCDVEDQEYMIYILNCHKEELETDLNYFIVTILESIRVDIEKEFKTHKDISDMLKNNYMDHIEYEDMKRDTSHIFNIFWKRIYDSWQLKIFEKEIEIVLKKSRNFMLHT